jgi:predicted RNase H-like nuclease (RuvC/YqgF family)
MFGNKRLDRIESAIEALTAQQAELRGSVERVVSMFEILIPEIREIQSEVRGLQAENRRIIERVFGPEG